MYDIQAASGRDKVQLIYRAQVYQNTGLDWKDVALVLSTSNPSIGNTKPILTAWNLVYGYPQSYIENLNKKVPMNMNNYGNFNQSAPQMDLQKITEGKKDDMTATDEEPQVPVFTVNDNFMRMEYVIKTKYSIQSDNKAHNVVINNMEIPVGLVYMSVPKLDKDAFLMGKVVDWEDLNLLPAKAKIYFDESYIGMTVVDPETTRDTMYLNLGRDKSIVIKRRAIKEKCREQVIGDYKIVSKTIEITVRNTKGINLQFQIEDQVPIASDNTIKVSLDKPDAAIYDEETGRLTWKLDIKSKDAKKLVFTYEVKYPKDKLIVGL
jgi:uncharacterized protein (TIGR02231 family)